MSAPVTILKLNPKKKMVYGWATMPVEKGKLVVDRQGDVIRSSALEDMATNFMLEYRVGKAMHDGDKIGEVVHSMPLTKEIQGAFGMDLDFEGWAIGMKIYDEATWAKFESGEYKGFSIGAMAKRIPYIPE